MKMLFRLTPTIGVSSHVTRPSANSTFCPVLRWLLELADRMVAGVIAVVIAKTSSVPAPLLPETPGLMSAAIAKSDFMLILSRKPEATAPLWAYGLAKLYPRFFLMLVKFERPTIVLVPPKSSGSVSVLLGQTNTAGVRAAVPLPPPPRRSRK